MGADAAEGTSLVHGNGRQLKAQGKGTPRQKQAQKGGRKPEQKRHEADRGKPGKNAGKPATNVMPDAQKGRKARKRAQLSKAQGEGQQDGGTSRAQRSNGNEDTSAPRKPVANKR